MKKSIYIQKVKIYLTPEFVDVKNTHTIRNRTYISFRPSICQSVKKLKNARKYWAAQCRDLNFGKDNPGADEAWKVDGEGLPKVPGTNIVSAFGFIGLTIWASRILTGFYGRQLTAIFQKFFITESGKLPKFSPVEQSINI